MNHKTREPNHGNERHHTNDRSKRGVMVLVALATAAFVRSRRPPDKCRYQPLFGLFGSRAVEGAFLDLLGSKGLSVSNGLVSHLYDRRVEQAVFDFLA